MNKLVKLGVVLAGYVGALLVACVAVYVRQFLTQDDAAQASSGMYAFGDFLLAVAVFGGLSLVPTGLALYFLRPCERFWTAASLAALMLAIAVVVAAVVMQRRQPGSATTALFCFGQVVAAPLLALGFLTGAVIAPTWRSRWALLAATTIEGSVSAYAFLSLFVIGRWP